MALVYNPPSYDLRAATFLFSASDDDTTPPSHQQLAFDRTIAPRHLITMAGARHSDFSDVCANAFLQFIPQIGDSCGDDPATTQVAVRTLVTAALHRYLRCDENAEQWLEPSAVTSIPGVGAFDADPGAGGALDADEPSLCDVEPSGAEIVHETKDIMRDDAPALHVESSGPSGEAPTLLLIHGFGTDSEIFSRQRSALESHYRVVALDLRGHGKSGLDPTAPHGPDGVPGTQDDPYRIESYVDDVVDVLEALDLHQVVLVGWSSGGQVAAQVALGPAGDRVRALALVDAAPLTRPDATIHPTYHGGGTLEFAHDIRLALGNAAPEPWRAVVENFFARDPEPSLVAEYFGKLGSIDPATRLGQMTAQRPDLVDMISVIRHPTLIIHGEEDDALLLESAHFMAAAIELSQILVFQRSGHTPFAEEPERFNHALMEFVNALP
jgi:pimeloyl-ACP methyl ester carboxylesterase